jgi:hypothetical protein
MANLKQQLEQIYNANQCMDLNDVNYAIEETRILIKQYPDNKAPINRLVSLLNRKEKLEGKTSNNSNMHPIFANALKPFGIK